MKRQGINSKYLNMRCGSWLCVYVGLASVTRSFKKGTRKPNKYPGHRNYYYIFERLTSDGKAEKMVRLNAAQIAKVARGILSVEDIAVAKKCAIKPAFTGKVSYSFID